MLTTCKHFDMVGNRCSRVTDGKCDDLPDCEFKYIEELKAEIETLKKVKKFACINLKNYIALADKYLGCLQEIKEIAMGIMDDDIEENFVYSDARQIIELITKAESEG